MKLLGQKGMATLTCWENAGKTGDSTGSDLVGGFSWEIPERDEGFNVKNDDLNNKHGGTILYNGNVMGKSIAMGDKPIW